MAVMAKITAVSRAVAAAGRKWEDFFKPELSCRELRFSLLEPIIRKPG
jgi:hypothetical protein